MKLYSKFARFYDGLYHRKDYGLEVDLILNLFEEIFEKKAKRVADFGCGTGKHVEIFTEKGLEAIGMDNSDHMLEIAKTRKGDFVKGDFIDDSFEGKFDIATCLFSTFQHATTRDEMLEALRNFYNQLGENGLVFIDIHNINSTMTFVNTLCEHDTKLAKTTTWRILSAENMKRESVWFLEEGGNVSFDVSEMTIGRIGSLELEKLAKEAGFDKVVRFGGWRGQKFSDDKRFIVMLVKQ